MFTEAGRVQLAGLRRGEWLQRTVSPLAKTTRSDATRSASTTAGRGDSRLAGSSPIRPPIVWASPPCDVDRQATAEGPKLSLDEIQHGPRLDDHVVGPQADDPAESIG